MIHLYSEDRAKKVVSMSEVVKWVSASDHGCLSTARRADVVEAFTGSFDTRSIIMLATAVLVQEGALIAECGEYCNLYHIRVTAVTQLNDVHLRLNKVRLKQ